jgi:hypothetical protein
VGGGVTYRIAVIPQTHITADPLIFSRLGDRVESGVTLHRNLTPLSPLNGRVLRRTLVLCGFEVEETLGRSCTGFNFIKRSRCFVLDDSVDHDADSICGTLEVLEEGSPVYASD